MADITRRLRSDCEVEAKGVAPALAEVQLCRQWRVAFVGEAEGTGATSYSPRVQGRHVTSTNLLALSKDMAVMSPATAWAYVRATNRTVVSFKLQNA